MSVSWVYIESDWRLDITVTDCDGDAVTDAAVTAKILNGSKTVDGSEITLVHQGAGLYQGWMPKTIAVVNHKSYNLRVQVIVDGKTSVFDETLVARYKDLN